MLPTSKRTPWVRCQALYKTEECTNWLNSGTCCYGARCQFAHGKHELRPRGTRAARPRDIESQVLRAEPAGCTDTVDVIPTEQLLFSVTYDDGLLCTCEGDVSAEPSSIASDVWKPWAVSQTFEQPAAASLEKVKSTIGTREYDCFLRLMGRYAAGSDTDKDAAIKGTQQCLAYCPSLLPGLCVFEPVLAANPSHAIALGASILALLVGRLPAAPPPRQAAWEREKQCTSPTSTMHQNVSDGG